eukprot:191649-Amphidinium_carterae.1
MSFGLQWQHCCRGAIDKEWQTRQARATIDCKVLLSSAIHKKPKEQIKITDEQNQFVTLKV